MIEFRSIENWLLVCLFASVTDILLKLSVLYVHCLETKYAEK